MIKYNKYNNFLVSRDIYQKNLFDKYAIDLTIHGEVYSFKVDTSFYKQLILKNISIIEAKKNIFVEYVSANPDYLNFHMGNFSCGLIGRSLIEFLKFKGHKVTSAYYINDMGERVRTMIAINYLKPELKAIDLYTQYISNKHIYTTNYIDEIYRRIPSKKIQEYRALLVNENINHIVNMLLKYNITFDKLHKQSDYINLALLNKYSTEESQMYYTLKNKKIYLNTSKNYPLYMLGDLKYTIAEKHKYDIAYTVIGADHQLHFNELQQIINIEGHKSNCEWVYVSSILLNNKKMSKSNNNFITLLNISTYPLAIFKFIKYYILCRTLDKKQSFDITFLNKHKYIFELDVYSLPELKNINELKNEELDEFLKFYVLFYYGYVSLKAYINELPYLTKHIIKFFESYKRWTNIDSLTNIAYMEYVHMKNMLLNIANIK